MTDLNKIVDELSTLTVMEGETCNWLCTEVVNTEQVVLW